MDTALRAYFCADPTATVADILGAPADRYLVEIAFENCKQLAKAGQQLIAAHLGQRQRIPDLGVELDANGNISPGAVMRMVSKHRSAFPRDGEWCHPSSGNKRGTSRRKLLGEG